MRASGPAWSSDHARGTTPRRLIRPYVGFRPATPHSEAGMRIEPPVSDPGERKHIPVARAIALPPLEPPGIRVGSQGFLALPKCGFWFVTPYAHSCRFVFPSSTAPPARSRSVMALSAVATLLARILEPAVVT